MPPSKYSESIYYPIRQQDVVYLVISAIVGSLWFCADVVILKALWRLHCHVASLPHMIILYTDLSLRFILYTASTFLVL